MDSLGCQRCYQLQAQIAQLQEKIRILTERQKQEVPLNSEIITESTVDVTLKLLLDPKSSPSDLNKINVTELANELLDFDHFTKELLKCSNPSKIIGFLIFLKGKDSLLAFKISELLVLEKRSLGVPEKITDSAKKLFPELSTIHSSVQEDLNDLGESENKKHEIKKEEIPDSDPSKALSRAKILLADLLEQSFTGTIDPQIFVKIRHNLSILGPESAYEEFIRNYLWSQFPKNLESSFGRAAFKSLIELLEYLLDMFKGNETIYKELQLKLSLVKK
jgi:hypothetical protein